MGRFPVRAGYLPLRYWLLISGLIYTCALVGLFLFACTHTDAPWQIFLVLGGGLTVFVGVTFGIFQMIVTPRVNHLLQITARFAQGDWRARANLTGNDEFATIGAAFNQMAEQLMANHQRDQQAEAVSSANHDLLQGLLATIDTVVWSATSDGLRYHYISPSVEQVYGRPLAAFIANPGLWLETIHPADRERELAAYQSMYRTGMKQGEYRIIRPDGAIRWLQDRTRLVCDQAGHPLRFDGVATDITAYKADQALLAERARFATLRAQISLLLTQSNPLPIILQQCSAAIVQHLDAAFVRIWTYNTTTHLLELQASAGLYTHLDGAHSRIALGQYKIGRIAEQRQALLLNNIATDPQISDQAWAQREGMVAFAGYPLLIDDTVVGVIAAFARHEWSPFVLEDLAFTAGGLAQLIKRKQIEAALQASEERLRFAVEGASHGLWDWDVVTGAMVVNQQWAAILGDELREIKPTISQWEYLIHPDDQPQIQAAFAAHSAGHSPRYECEHRVRTKTNEWKWVLDRGQIVTRDPQGQALRVTGILEDIHARKQAELILQNFFRLSLDLLCIASIDGYFKYMNPAFEEMLGFSVAELLAIPLIELVHPKDVASALEKIEQLTRGHEVIDFEIRCRRKDGAYRWLSWRATATSDGLLYAVARDVTAQKRQTQLMEQTHVAAQVGGWELDLMTNQLSWTAETYRIHDTTPADYTPTLDSAIAFYAPASVPMVTTAVQRALTEGEPWEFELELITAKKRRIWVHAIGKVEMEDGQAVRAYGSFQDITERKRLALLMAQTQAAAQVGGWELDWFTNKLYWTDETYRIYDTTPEQYQPSVETMFQFYAPENIALITAAGERALQGGQAWSLELEMHTARQRHVWVHMTGQIQIEEGQPVKVFGSLQDITARKQTEVALRQSEGRNRAILDALPDTVFVTDRDGVLLDTHSTEPSTYYVPIDEFLGKQIEQVLPSPLGQQLRHTIRAAADGTRQLLEYPLLLQDKLHYFEARIVPLEGDKVLAIVRDVTERKQMEEERFIRKIAEAVPFMMYVYDLDEQRHVYVNHQVRQDLGYTPDEFLHMHSTFVNLLLHTADLQRFPDLLSRWDQAHDGEVFETEYQMKHKDGEWRWFAGRDTVFLRHPDGSVHQIIGTAQDITAMKRTQQQMLNALKEKEALLKEVHHRVKNNLQIISSLLNLQAAQIKDAAILNIFTETKNRVRSMALLHETLYRTENLARIDFPRYVENLCAHLFRSYGVDAQRIGLQTAIASVTLDLDRAIPCGLIINELISNAVKYAFPEQRRGHVRIELQQLSAQYYQLHVCDNGIGLPPDLNLAQTESLGLSLVYDLTRQLNGEIQVDCTAGTAFTICFGP